MLNDLFGIWFGFTCVIGFAFLLWFVAISLIIKSSGEPDDDDRQILRVLFNGFALCWAWPVLVPWVIYKGISYGVKAMNDA